MQNWTDAELNRQRKLWSGYRSENLARLKDHFRTVDSITGARAAVAEAETILSLIEKESCRRSEANRIACGFDD